MARVDGGMVTSALELAGLSNREELRDCAGHYCSLAQCDRKSGSGVADHRGWQHHDTDDLCERTREDAFELMLQHATERGANAVVCMRYDTTEVMQGVTEVLAYGTAVQVERTS